MNLITAHQLVKSYGSKTLFEEISFTISQGDRIGLLGPNGAGKSTLLKVLMGIEPQDRGSISKKQGLRMGYASQVPELPNLPLEEVLAGDLVRARTLLSKAGFSDFRALAGNLSGGWKKRLDIVRALMDEPDLLLLDEPTNHLDIDGILWLEKFLAKERISYVIVSHDRYFLESTCEKMMELNRCYPQGLLLAEGTLSEFMEHKEAFLKVQLEEQKSLSNLVRTEVDWLRRSPKARTTKSVARIQRAYDLMETLSQVKERNHVAKVGIAFADAERSTRKLLAGKNLAKTLGGKILFKGLDIVLSPGMRLGIVGKNGTGKTTLLKTLAGHMLPDLGTIKYADDLKLVYFDQHREELPPHLTIREALSSTDTVNYRGQSIHVNGWAKRFLFSQDRLTLPISCLSGGERARLLIAKLMLQPADILFLDEPTNDLDIQTLEVIEESLNEFSGAVVLISHDRCLMDRVCTQILGLGDRPEYYADYSQWEATLVPLPSKELPPSKPKQEKAPSKKISYHEKKEWEGIEEAIVACEQTIADLSRQLGDTKDPKDSLALYHQLSEAEKKLEHLFERWQYLESLITSY